MSVFKAIGLRYRINIFSGGEGVYILSGVKEKRQESQISTIVWVFQLLLAGIVGVRRRGNHISLTKVKNISSLFTPHFLLEIDFVTVEIQEVLAITHYKAH